MEPVIIGVDTGNRCIKTRGADFIAGIKSFSSPPAFGQDVIVYNGLHYMLSTDRVGYLQDKTETEEYFVLALFGIVKELMSRGIPLQKNAPIPIHLGIGLPPSHVARLRDKFIQYFNRGQVNFRYNNQSVAIKILDVRLLAQGYAAIATLPAEVRQYAHAYIVDMGGYTTDVMALEHGMLDPKFCESLSFGVIQLYSLVQRRLIAETGHQLEESMIDDLLRGVNTYSAEMINAAEETANAYVDALLRKLLELGIDLTINRGIFVGGGAVLLRPRIERSNYISHPYFTDDIHANAIGYELFVQAFEAQKG